MSRRAAIAIFVASACWTGSVAAATSAPKQNTPHVPAIPGTLDPTTGKFTPDAPRPNAATSTMSGTINLVFNIDAIHATRTSIVCVVNAYFTADGTFYGGNRVNGFYPDFDSKNNRFIGTLPVDFAFSYENSGRKPTSVIDVECRYTFDPEAIIYSERFSIDAVEEANLVPVQGSMDARTPAN